MKRALGPAIGHRPWESLTDDSLVLRQLLSSDASKPTPPPSSYCKLSYRLFLDPCLTVESCFGADADEFLKRLVLEEDHIIDEDPSYLYQLGRGDIRAFSICVQTLHVGETCLLLTHPEYAYGEAGLGSQIPPNAVLLYEISLLEFEIDYLRIPPSEFLRLIESMKMEGNSCFRQGDFDAAAKRYQKALEILDQTHGQRFSDFEDSGDVERSVLVQEIAIRSNLTAACLKLRKFEMVLAIADRGINHVGNLQDPELREACSGMYVKMRFRKSTALRELGRFREAIDDLEQAIGVNPNPMLTRMLANVRAELIASETPLSAVVQEDE